MDPLCQSTRDRLAFQAGTDCTPEREVRLHLEDCAECRAWQFGLERRVAALRDLSPLAAPEALDGLVVSALHAGARQERALRHLGALERRLAPAALDERAEERLASLRAEDGALLDAPRSPAVLERLVSEDLQDLPRAIVRRLTSKLSRKPAPAELEGRVQRELAKTGTILRFRPIAAAAAAVLLGVFGWTQFSPQGTTDVDDSGGPGPVASERFDVHHIDTLADYADGQHDPFAQRLADELSNSRLSIAELGLVGGNTFADQSGDDPAGDDPEGDAPDAPDAPSGGGGGSPGSGSATQPGAATQPAAAVLLRVAPVSRELLGRMADVHGAPVYLKRLVMLHDPEMPNADLVYEEHLWRDGSGAFSVEPGAVLTPQMNATEEATFGLLQGARQGFVERHRDFRIHDLPLFQQNYTVTDMRQTVQLAGVYCQVIEVHRRDNAVVFWRLAVDPKTGRVLLEERIDVLGKLRARIEVLEVSERPSLNRTVLDGGPSSWTPVSSATLATMQIHVPGFIPDGYLPVETATLQDVTGRAWLRQLYTDGVSEFFFLHALSNSTGPIVSARAKTTTRDVLNSLSLGGMRVLDGEVSGVRVIAVGMLPEFQILQAIDSAIQ